MRELTESLGPFTARNAVKTFARRAVNKDPEGLTPDDVPKLLDALRPMLRTLCGVEKATEIVAHLTSELGK